MADYQTLVNQYFSEYQRKDTNELHADLRKMEFC